MSNPVSPFRTYPILGREVQIHDMKPFVVATCCASAPPLCFAGLMEVVTCRGCQQPYAIGEIAFTRESAEMRVSIVKMTAVALPAPTPGSTS